MDAWFLCGRFCGDINIVVAVYALVARNPQQGDFIGDHLKSGDKFQIFLLVASIDGISFKMDGNFENLKL